MIFQLLAVLMLIVIVYALGSAFFQLVRRQGDSEKMAKRLSWRIGLSLLLFVILIVAALMGWIRPQTRINLSPSAPQAQVQVQ